MKTKRISKKIMGMTLALALSFALLVPAFQVHAAGSYVSGSINADGVNFRAEGSIYGTVLGTMYKLEVIRYYPYDLGIDPEYRYMMRQSGVQSGWYGYVDHHYVNY